jgi:hypothetical protein
VRETERKRERERERERETGQSVRDPNRVQVMKLNLHNVAHVRQSRLDSGVGVQMKVHRKVDMRLHGKGNSNSHGARLVHQITSMVKWIQISRLSTKKSLSL